MQSSWDHDDVFPVIAGLIDRLYARHRRFVTARELAEELLRNSSGRVAIEEAHRRQDEKASREKIAENMVSWFSQKITEGNSNWSGEFDRIKVDGVWAYKPAKPQ